MLQTIKLEDITSNGNVRIDLGDLDGLIKSIAREGVLQPPTVVPAETEGQYITLYGHRRLAAVEALGLTETVCNVDVETDTNGDVTAKQYAENTFRKGLTDYEQLVVAWELKLAGNKQAEVAEIMGKTTKAISKLHKTHKALASDDLDPTRATQLDAESLFQIGETVPPGNISDVIRLIVSGEHNSVWGALKAAERETETAEFLDELAVLQVEWADMNVEVVTTDPSLNGKTDTHGNKGHYRTVVRLQETGIPFEEHIKLSCHVVWLNSANVYGTPQVTHMCNNTKRHMPDSKGRADSVISERMVTEKKFSEKNKAGRRKDRDAKQLRREQAAFWMDEKETAGNRELMMIGHALRKWGADETKACLTMLDLLKDRPVGAGYDWYSKTLGTYFKNRFGDDKLKQDRWKVRFLTAYEFINDTYGSNTTFHGVIKGVELPSAEEG